jgi:hypothetical protein
MSYDDGYAGSRESTEHEFAPLPGPASEVARALIKLDERVALKICDALGERFGWSADERDEALTLVVGAMAAGMEGMP